MIGTGIDVRVKIQDIVSSQLPEFILSEAPLTDDFLKQFYVSQEFQGGAMDFAANLDQYLSLETLTDTAISGQFFLTEDLSVEDTVVHVNTTKSFPNEWGLLKVDDEIMTYTGVTTNTFTGVVRGFSGITSYHDPANPGELVFESTEAASHASDARVENLSTLFLKEFYDKLKFTFAPGFENLDFDADINVGNWIRQARSFYQSKGSAESIIILFKVLYGEVPTVIDLEQFLIKSSEAEYRRRDFAVGIPVEGNPKNLQGRTIFQEGTTDVFGAISEIEPFTRNDELYYKIYFFVSNEEISNERKLFTVPALTKAQRDWKQGDTTITVDSTIGFRDNGHFITADGTVFSYEERTVNQFLGVTCEDPSKTVAITDEIIDDIKVSGTDSEGNVISMRLTGVISEVVDPESFSLTSVGEKIRVDSLGENILAPIASRDEPVIADILANSFIYNTSVRFEVQSVNGTVFQLKAPYLDKSSINVGDTVDILPRGSQDAFVRNRAVTNVDFVNSTVSIDDSFGIPTNFELDIRRNQKYASSSSTPIDYGNDAVLANVLNLYDAREFDSSFYVATNSLPSYQIDAKIVESSIDNLSAANFEGFNSFTNSYSTLIFESGVEFITGDLIKYTVQAGVGTTAIFPICEPGEYFVEVNKSDSRKIRLFLSPSFIGSENFVELTANNEEGTHIFTLESQRNRSIDSQKTYRKIPVSDNINNIAIDRLPAEVEPGKIAVLTNGVEIISYRSGDFVYLGPLTDIEATFGGDGYSVTSPPELSVTDPVVQMSNGDPVPVTPTTAKATPVLKGKLEKILIDPLDFDINEAFTITVTGGNSSGSTAEPILERKNRSVPFDTRLDIFGGGINPNEETIQFLFEHNFPRGEAVVYNNRGGNSIGVANFGLGNVSQGNVLSDGGIYYVEPVNNLTVRLYTTIDDLNSGINTVGFTSNRTGYGVQSFDTLSKVTLTGANIIENESTFWYRNLSVKPENVFVEYDEVRYDNHGFTTGDLVEYSNVGTPIGGLSTTSSYYVFAKDEDSFKLADAGIGGTSTFNFDRADYVTLTSPGIGTHSFKYPEINVNVTVSFASTITGIVTATPVIRGEIVQVYVNDGGYYGSDILNFEKVPQVSVSRGTGARIKPIIVEGTVSSAQILNGGVNYPDAPDLNVIDSTGSGAGALLRGVVQDGKIVDVVIIEGGISYDENATTIDVVDPSTDAILTPRIRKLELNLNERFGFESLENNSYSVCSYERTIREDVYGDNGLNHSPIIGWSNDGNPIYGGFGYSQADNANSSIVALETAYKVRGVNEQIFGRPSLTTYPLGFFVEDYIYTGSGDLDEYNGRYCRTPEFPNGVYAYFAGISTDTQSLERTPQFPYFIGPEFRDATIDTADIDQSFNINDKPIYRNTFPYAVGSPVSGSEFLVQSYLSDVQDTIIEAINPGSVKDITIVGAGNSYRTGDKPVFDTTEDILSTVVSEVNGPAVLSIEESYVGYGKAQTKLIRLGSDKVRIFIDPSHELLNEDRVVLSGLSTVTSLLAGPKIITVDNSRMTLQKSIAPTAFGEVTDIVVNTITSNVSVGSSVVIGLGQTTEMVSVLNIFPNNKTLRIDRPVGYAQSHFAGTFFTPLPNYIEVATRSPEFASETDYEYFFNPFQTIGIGTDPGDSQARVFTIGDVNYDISVPTRSIYAPSHQFRNNEPITLSADGGGPIQARTEGGTILNLPSFNGGQYFAANNGKDIVGIRTERGAAPVYFTNPGSNNFKYSIKSNRFAETVTVEKIEATVTTEKPHRLLNGDIVDMTVNSMVNSGVGSNPTVVVEFDNFTKSIIIDPQSATGVSTGSNLITVPNHGYVLGDYVIYKNFDTPIGGLVNSEKYFVIPFDTDSFRLGETFEDIKPGQELPVNLTAPSVGSDIFAKVNPKLDITISNNVEFDVSSATLLNSELKFFYDQEQTEIFENNGIDSEFVVSGVGTEGTAGARKIVQFSKNNPNVFYYGLDVGGFISTSDTNANLYNSVQYVDSVYAIRSNVTVGTSTVFTYSLMEKPESSVYTPDDSELSYTTSSRTALGGVGKVRIVSTGSNFTELPEFITVDSETGDNATLKAVSDEIGTIASYRIQNSGWGYSADNTLRPKGQLQQKLEFTDSDFVSSIDVVFGGNGYQSAPGAVLLDATTREVVDNGSISIEVQSSSVTGVNIDLPPTGLSKNSHELYTINNSNGIPIIEVDFVSETTGIVSFIIQTPINGYSEPPFQVGDEVFIENIIAQPTAPGEEPEALNMNSDEYGYRFFPVIDVSTANPISVVVQYPPNSVGAAQTLQGAFSSIVNKKIYPQFRVNQSTAIFTVGERLSVFQNGELIETDLVVEESNSNFFKVSGAYDLLEGDSIKGSISGVIATVLSVTGDECRYEVNSISRVLIGWNDNIGFLNDDQQVTPDNDYYQNLSYSIKSEQIFEEWIGPVNRLVHPAGLKNFADTKIESVGNVGAGLTADGSDTITIDLIGLTDVANTPLRVDRINIFDLGYDDEILNNRSNAIRFNSLVPRKRLTPYVEVKTNRVLLADDISDLFIDNDNIRGQKPYTDFNVVTGSFTRGLLQARNPFTDQVQFTEVILLAFNNNAFTLQKAVVSDNEQGYGVFDGNSFRSTEYSLRFTPFDSENFDIDYKLFTNKFIGGDDPSLNILSYVDLSGGEYLVAPGQEVLLRRDFGISNVTSIIQYVEITDFSGNPSYYEVYAFLLNGTVHQAVYGFDSSPTEGYNDDLSGYFQVRFEGGDLRVFFQNETGEQLQISTKETRFTRILKGTNVYRFKRDILAPGEERSINLITSESTGTGASAFIDLITVDVNLFQSMRSVYLIQSPSFGAMHQVMSINSDSNTYTNEYPFLTEGDGVPGPGIGTFGSEIDGNNWTLRFYPDAGLSSIEPIEIYGYHEAFYRKVDNVNYVNDPLTYAEVEENYVIDRYIAPQGERTNITRFPMEYEGIPIFEKSFFPPTTIVPIIGSSDRSIFEIKDHFFSQAEELYYEPGTTVEFGTFSKIEIEPTVDYTGVTTVFMPDRVWAIKRDLNRFQVAATEQDAIQGKFIVVTGDGTGNSHLFGMVQKLDKTVITIDGVLQSPIASANIVFPLDEPIDETEEYFTLTGVGTIRAGDIFRAEEEYVIVKNVGLGTSSTGPIRNEGPFPLINVERGALGSIPATHPVGLGMTIYRGSYNIVESDIVFTEAPSGKGEFSINESNLVETNSSFQGRVFLQQEYDQNRIYDDISDQFNGIDNAFTITSNGSATGIGTTGGPIENGSGLLLINDIYQTPSTPNNEGNNYVFEYDVNTGINTVVFTGITSANGQRVESLFDVNQNQIPRGGLIVSLGSTPGLGYAPLVPAILEPVISGGVIVGVNTLDSIGITTAVRYAKYDNMNGELTVSIGGTSLTAPQAVSGATYFPEGGLLIVQTASSLGALGFQADDVVILDGLEFSCTSGAGTTTIFPDKDDTFVIDTVIDDNSFSVAVGVSTLEHTYVSGGTFQKVASFEFGNEGNTPNFAYLSGLEFACPSGQTAGLTTTIFPVDNNNFPVYERLDNGHYVLQVGVSTLVHEYVGGGEVGQYTKNSAGSGYNTVVSIAATEIGHAGAGASIIGVPGPGGSLDIQIIDGGSGYSDAAQTFAPDPVYANLPVTGVFRRTTGVSTTDTGKNLFVTCEIGAATTTAIGRSEYFEVSNFEITNQGYGFLEGDVIEVVGLVTDARLSAPLEPFQLTVERTFTDNFSAWNFGELDYIDDIKSLQDGERTRFPLKYNGLPLSFEQNPEDEDSAAIDMDSILLIFVNTVLQVPGQSYTFSGGTSFEFAIPPVQEDNIDIYFYYGKRGVDTNNITSVSESIRPGDELQIKKNDVFDPSKTQDLRTVTEIASSDTVRTNIYFGNDDLDATNQRPVAWDKQKRDIFIYGEVAPKTRDSIESIIKPTGNIIRSLNDQSLTIYTDTADLFEYESSIVSPLTNVKARIYPEIESFRPAKLQATVAFFPGFFGGGEFRISDIVVVDPGAGYPSKPQIVISPPNDQDGTPCIVSPSNIIMDFNNGIADIFFVSESSRGSKYDPANPPPVFAVDPATRYEDLKKIPTINGFAAQITAIEFSTTPPVSNTKRIRFRISVDPTRYELADLVQMVDGDSFVVLDSVVGSGVISRTRSNGGTVGIGTEFMDAVYEVDDVQFTGYTGFIDTLVQNVTATPDLPISGDNLGYISWGRMNVERELPGEGALNYTVDGAVFNRNMDGYPTVVRSSEGLRNEGGLSKRL